MVSVRLPTKLKCHAVTAGADSPVSRFCTARNAGVLLLCTLWQAYPGTASLADHTQAYSVSHTISTLHGTSTKLLHSSFTFS